MGVLHRKSLTKPLLCCMILHTCMVPLLYTVHMVVPPPASSATWGAGYGTFSCHSGCRRRQLRCRRHRPFVGKVALSAPVGVWCEHSSGCGVGFSASNVQVTRQAILHNSGEQAVIIEVFNKRASRWELSHRHISFTSC